MIKFIDNLLTKEECDNIIDYSLTSLDLRAAKVITDNGVEIDGYRKSEVAFDRYEEFDFLNKKVMDLVLENVSVNGCDIGFNDKGYQFTSYKPGQYYNWHNDSSNQRYCSFVVQLNDGYVGGELELIDNDKVQRLKHGAGNAVIFLSDMNHRVTEVIEGVRYSLVCWLILKPNHKKTII